MFEFQPCKSALGKNSGSAGESGIITYQAFQ